MEAESRRLCSLYLRMCEFNSLLAAPLLAGSGDARVQRAHKISLSWIQELAEELKECPSCSNGRIKIDKIIAVKRSRKGGEEGGDVDSEGGEGETRDPKRVRGGDAKKGSSLKGKSKALD